MRVAIAYSTKDRHELSVQTWPAIRDAQCAAIWVDGSNGEEAKAFFEAERYLATYSYPNIRGGADTAIVFALTRMLSAPQEFTHIGLLENDVLLPDDWFERTMNLFDEGAFDGLNVGAVSARCFDDRILIQRDSYAICHNLGAGHIVFTRKAAQIVLDFYRTGWWPANRKVFAQLSGIDIGEYACFRGNEQPVTCDWHWDAVLAQYGFASLALTPSPVQMIGQVPSLEEVGLKLSDKPVEELRNEEAFRRFRLRAAAVRGGQLKLDVIKREQEHSGTRTYFVHQLPRIGARFNSGWNLKWSQGYGGFSYVSDGTGKVELPVAGPFNVVASGGKLGARIIIRDKRSGFEINPDLPPEGETMQVMTLSVPGHVGYRDIEIETTKGLRLFSIQTSDAQPSYPDIKFDYSTLPPVGD